MTGLKFDGLPVTFKETYSEVKQTLNMAIASELEDGPTKQIELAKQFSLSQTTIYYFYSKVLDLPEVELFSESLRKPAMLRESDRIAAIAGISDRVKRIW